jgi:hypothetical protein
LQILAFKSENEAFGVNKDFEFFFRERETKHIDRGIDNSDWFNYDLPERGKEAVNEVEVRYNNGNDKVIVDNPGQKLALQDNLNLPAPGTQRVRINRPEITDAQDAEDEGRRFLKFRNATLSGTVTTYGIYDAEPFDTIDVAITDRGIDTEFIITKVEKNWARDETTLTLVENRGFDEDFIVRLSEKTERIDLRDSDPDADVDRITSTNVGIDVAVSGAVAGAEIDNSRVTNPGRNQLRNGWIGDGNITVADVVIGTDNSGLSRSNTDLRNQVAAAPASETLPSNTEAEYSATFSQSDVEEIGLKDGSGNLLCRAILDSPIDLSSDTVSITVGFETDPDVSRAVATTDGQITARDIFADNSPDLSATYAYGSDDTSPTESDTALGNQVYSTGLDEIRVQSASTNSEFNNIVSINSDEPLAVRNDRIELLQASFTTESDQLTRSGTALQPQTEFSNDEAERIEGSGDFLELDFTLDYTIPESDVGVWVRLTTALAFDGAQNGTGPELTLSLNGDSWTPVSSGAGFGSLDWRDLGNNTFGASGTYSGGDLTPGSYTLRIEGTSSGDGQDIDVVSVLDNRFTWTFDETEASGDRVDGPELYPQQYVKSLDTASTRRDTDSARFDSTWNDTTNGQFVELANDGSTFTRFNNASSGSATFADKESGIDSNLAFSRFGSDSSKTPTTGRNGQYISEWNLFAGIKGIVPDGIGELNVRGIIQNSDLTQGDVLQEAAQLDANGDALTRSVFADVEIDADTNDLISSETVTFRNP